jgi:hypothetical protein
MASRIAALSTALMSTTPVENGAQLISASATRRYQSGTLFRFRQLATELASAFLAKVRETR